MQCANRPFWPLVSKYTIFESKKFIAIKLAISDNEHVGAIPKTLVLNDPVYLSRIDVFFFLDNLNNLFFQMSFILSR